MFNLFKKGKCKCKHCWHEVSETFRIIQYPHHNGCNIEPWTFYSPYHIGTEYIKLYKCCKCDEFIIFTDWFLLDPKKDYSQKCIKNCDINQYIKELKDKYNIKEIKHDRH